MPRARRIGGLADMDKRASFEVGKVLDKGCVTYALPQLLSCIDRFE